jgi:Spy/CpxP family protein refolding chaperone
MRRKMRTPGRTSICIAVIVGGSALLNAVSAANAGQATAPKDSAKNSARNRMAGREILNELNLTNAQKTRIKAIQTDTVRQRQAISGSTSLTPDQKKLKTRSLAMSAMKQTMAVLTPEQKKTLQTKMQAMFAGMAQRQPKIQSRKGAAPVAPKP